MNADDEIRATSYAVAIEQALWFAEQAYGPAEIMAAIGMSWGPRAATWEDAVYSLAYVWRQRGRATGLLSPTPFRRAA